MNQVNQKNNKTKVNNIIMKIKILNKLTPLTSLNVTEISSELTSTWFVSWILNIVPVNSTKNEWLCNKNQLILINSNHAFQTNMIC